MLPILDAMLLEQKETGVVWTPSKGQIKSEWIYEITNFSKNDPKNLKDFCPMYCKNCQGRNPSNFWGHFLEIDDFTNSF